MIAAVDVNGITVVESDDVESLGLTESMLNFRAMSIAKQVRIMATDASQSSQSPQSPQSSQHTHSTAEKPRKPRTIKSMSQKSLDLMRNKSLMEVYQEYLGCRYTVP